MPASTSAGGVMTRPGWRPWLTWVRADSPAGEHVAGTAPASEKNCSSPRGAVQNERAETICTRYLFRCVGSLRVRRGAAVVKRTQPDGFGEIGRSGVRGVILSE